MNERSRVPNNCRSCGQTLDRDSCKRRAWFCVRHAGDFRFYCDVCGVIEQVPEGARLFVIGGPSGQCTPVSPSPGPDRLRRISEIAPGGIAT